MKYVIRTLQQITLNSLGKVTALSPSQWFYTIDRVSAERSRVFWSSSNALPFRRSFRQPLRAVLIRSKFMKSVLLAPYPYHFFLAILRFEISPILYLSSKRREDSQICYRWKDVQFMINITRREAAETCSYNVYVQWRKNECTNLKISSLKRLSSPKSIFA